MDWHELLLTETPFKSAKSILWLNIVKVVLEDIEQKELEFFEDKESSPQETLEAALFMALYWKFLLRIIALILSS